MPIGLGLINKYLVSGLTSIADKIVSIGLGLINKYLVSMLTLIADKIVSIGLALIVYERASVHVDTDS